MEVLLYNIPKFENGSALTSLKVIDSNSYIWEYFDEKNVIESINDIYELFNMLNQELLSSEIKSTKESSNSFAAKIAASVITLTKGKQKKEQVEQIVNSLLHNNASRYILEFFKELHKILNLDYSLLLLDEISGVGTKAQVEVFRLLRLIRGSTETTQGNNFLYFIGSVYPTEKTNYPSVAKGYDFDFIQGEDCSMEYLEMDVLHDEYEQFFRYIIVNRLRIFHPKYGQDILTIFEDEKTFYLATYAANGLPRRFFEIIGTAYSEATKKFLSEPSEKKIDFNSVSSAIQHIVDSQTLNESQLTDEDLVFLEEKIIPRLTTRNASAETKNEARAPENKLPVHVFISVSRADRRKLSNLIYRGVIHNLSKTRKSKNSYNVESEYNGIMLMLDLSVALYHRVFNIQKAVEYFQKDLPDNSKRGYKYFSEIKL
ncbi:hypothetical protein VO178_21700 [Lysinibacillus fusiformis]|uniref:hypothetical protein n=1 Tax=Lysinibacillus fusiformis TaxID=28031 RepID=UPI002D784174|nr:hypothetical protein [Lysinibacillus fusiformis]WRS97924.1 hypothetical protein VO178_21700 [Lysinibacillus fusiformis]